MVFPGTELYELARTKGILDDNYWLSNLPAPFYTGEHSLKILRYWERRLLLASSKGIERYFRIIQLCIEKVFRIKFNPRAIISWGKCRSGYKE